MEQAESYFTTFFQGCHRYVPIFDPRHDSMESIRRRSVLLFSVICSVGCRILSGTESQHWHLLNFHIKRMLNGAITAPARASLETVQALLVRACYAPERSLLVAVATRTALDLGLPEAYDELSTRHITRTSQGPTSGPGLEDEVVLMRKTRTWLHLHVLGNILHVDAGDLPTFKFSGDVRRCRVLLDTTFSTEMDFALLSQVELNVLRTRIYDSLSNRAGLDDEGIMAVVRDAKIDVEVWFDDWIRIFTKSPTDALSLGPNLCVQRCWADSMALCRAVRASGVENVDAMSPTQRQVLLMAKDALRQHLAIILEEPRSYLRQLRFAMDFVWAKCVFCFLLLLKLSILLPDDHGNGNDDATRASQALIEDGNTLVAEMAKAGGGNTAPGRSNTSQMYLRLLQSSIEKYRNAVGSPKAGGIGSSGGVGYESTQSSQGVEGGSSAETGQKELESFVPEQFIFEWDFPGLTLFSSPTTDAGWLDEFLLGSMNGGDDFYWLGWPPADFVQ